MSKYMIDKLLRTIDATDSDLEAFRADAAAYIDRWEEEGSAATPPFPAGGHLSPEEREAFEAWDYEHLYALGAHPYLLWMLMRSLYAADQRSIDELVASYRAAVEPYGYPGYTS